LIGFGVNNGHKFIESVELCTHATNLGDARTIVTYPAGTTHRQLSCEQKKACGITDDFIRISVGLEHIDDIIQDIDKALKC
jgi:O-acetylhomoserine (thiol)-lyase